MDSHFDGALKECVDVVLVEDFQGVLTLLKFMLHLFPQRGDTTRKAYGVHNAGGSAQRQELHMWGRGQVVICHLHCLSAMLYASDRAGKEYFFICTVV